MREWQRNLRISQKPRTAEASMSLRGRRSRVRAGAIVAEATSLVTNLGTKGVGYINSDLTVALSRLPVDDWICIQGDSHWASDGIAVGAATLFDHEGAFGSGMTDLRRGGRCHGFVRSRA
ncbi:MAG: hypothetical protein ACXWDJ_07910 [Aeromicrobium sp.]